MWSWASWLSFDTNLLALFIEMISRHYLCNKIGRLHQNNSTPTLLQPAASNVFATLEREGTWAKLDFAKTSGNDLGTHYSAIGQFLFHVSSNSPKILCKSYLYPVSPRFLSGEIAAWAGQERFSCGLGWVGLRLCLVGWSRSDWSLFGFSFLVKSFIFSRGMIQIWIN